MKNTAASALPSTRKNKYYDAILCYSMPFFSRQSYSLFVKVFLIFFASGISFTRLSTCINSLMHLSWLMHLNVLRYYVWKSYVCIKLLYVNLGEIWNYRDIMWATSVQHGVDKCDKITVMHFSFDFSIEFHPFFFNYHWNPVCIVYFIFFRKCCVENSDLIDWFNVWTS